MFRVFRGQQFLRNLNERVIFCKRFCGASFLAQDLDFLYEFFDDIFAADAAHGDAVFKDHADISAECDAKLRIVSFAGAVYGTAHDREVQRFLDVCEAAFDLGNDLDNHPGR